MQGLAGGKGNHSYPVGAGNGGFVHDDLAYHCRAEDSQGGRIEQLKKLGIPADLQSQAFFEYQARCPACQTLQRMDFDNNRIPAGERSPKRIVNECLAWYECNKCGYRWSDRVRNKAMAHWQWAPSLAQLADGKETGKPVKDKRQSGQSRPRLAVVNRSRPSWFNNR